MSDVNGAENLYKKTKDSEPLAVTHFRSGRVLWPSISADGSAIVFERDFRIWKYDTHLGTAAQVAITLRGSPAGAGIEHRTLTTGFRDLALSPDGKKIAFASDRDGNLEIYVMSPTGANQTRLTSTPGAEFNPAYAPNGNKIAFHSSRDGNYEIYVMNADGGNVRRLTNSPYRDLRPRFSPDGKRIAFTSHRDGNAEIYVMNADGTAPRRLTHNPDRDDYPAWHPDGRRLVYVSERDGKHDLYTIAVPD